MAKSARPSRVRQQPPELRCCTLTGRIVLSASLLVKMSRSGQPGRGGVPVTRHQVTQDVRVQGLLSPGTSVPGGVAGLNEQGGHLHVPVLPSRLELVQVLQVPEQVRPHARVQRAREVPVPAVVAVTDDDPGIAGQVKSGNAMAWFRRSVGRERMAGL
jgi:hypothetical protein